VLLLDTAVLQTPFDIELIVTVVDPAAVITEEGIVNVPVLAPIVSVAVFPADELAPLSAYVTVNVPVPSEVLFTVTVLPLPKQIAGAEGEVKTEMLGLLPTLNAAVLLLVTEVVQPDAVAN
jgi:hypothetical protein